MSDLGLKIMIYHHFNNINLWLIVMLNPVWLQTFKALIETGSFTRAADKLYMTQPGVSQHIQKLEAACGHLLLKRINKSFELTEQGELVYQHALQLEKNEAKLLDSLNANNLYQGECRVGCSGSLALVLYPQLLQLQTKHPQLIVQLEAAPNRNILSALKNARLDLGIVTEYPDNGEFKAEPLGEEALCLILPKNKNNTQAPLSALNQLGLIRHPDVDHYLSLYLSKCGLNELSEKNSNSFATSGYVNQINQILAPVAQEVGFTVLPKSALDSFADSAQLAVLATPNIVTEPLFLVSKRHRQLPKRFITVSQVIHSAMNV